MQSLACLPVICLAYDAFHSIAISLFNNILYEMDGIVLHLLCLQKHMLDNLPR